MASNAKAFRMTRHGCNKVGAHIITMRNRTRVRIRKWLDFSRCLDVNLKCVYSCSSATQCCRRTINAVKWICLGRPVEVGVSLRSYSTSQAAHFTRCRRIRWPLGCGRDHDSVKGSAWFFAESCCPATLYVHCKVVYLRGANEPPPAPAPVPLRPTFLRALSTHGI
jgi:hypothetical protein